MKHYTWFTGLSLLLALLACTPKTDQQVESNQVEQDQAPAEHNAFDQKAPNGKWLINTEMKPPIERSEKLLNAYMAEGQTDFASLANALTAENQTLIKSCTMEGASHDALHEWLYPHMDLLKSLAATTEAATADSLISQLKTSFETFHRDFQ